MKRTNLENIDITILLLLLGSFLFFGTLLLIVGAWMYCGIPVVFLFAAMGAGGITLIFTLLYLEFPELWIYLKERLKLLMIPRKNLPLHIHDVWECLENEDEFIRRLKGKSRHPQTKTDRVAEFLI